MLKIDVYDIIKIYFTIIRKEYFMYSNEEFLEHQEKTKHYAEYRKKMRGFQKIASIAFISNLPVMIFNIIDLIIAFAILDFMNTMLPAFISLVVFAVLTILSTYSKNKKAAFALVAAHLLSFGIFTNGISNTAKLISPISIIINALFIKSLYDEDKLKQIEGYPLFDERINIYSKVHNVENIPCETKINYTEKSEMEELSLDNAKNLPEHKTNSYEMESI